MSTFTLGNGEARSSLPGGTGRLELQDALGRALDRPGLIVDDIACTPIDHSITAPSTASLTRVRITAHDGRGLVLQLVAKALQDAVLGLPPLIPEGDRQRIAAGIPWRLEWEVYTSDTALRMPPGLRLPHLYAVTAHEEHRLTLWLEDVETLEGAWDEEDLARAAAGLARLAVRRADQVLATQPETSFLAHLVANGLRDWAIPAVRSEAPWQHPSFQQDEVAELRPRLLALAETVDDRFAELSDVPWLQMHGDPTPMNLLRSATEPGICVLIDWGTATPGPVGWDLVPLIFGPAENGMGEPAEIARRLAVTAPAYVEGLAAEGTRVSTETVRDVVHTCAAIRYPLTSLPLSDVLRPTPPRDDLDAYARRKARFVRTVLDLCT